MGLSIAFWVMAIVSVVGALLVISVKNVFRAALALIVSLLGVAALYVTLSADFLAAVQILVYVGGISILILIAIMLTREVEKGSQPNKLRGPALIVSAFLFAVMIFGMVGTNWPVSNAAPATPTTPVLASKLFGEGGFLLPIEIAGALLLAAILGAIVVAREK